MKIKDWKELGWVVLVIAAFLGLLALELAVMDGVWPL